MLSVNVLLEPTAQRFQGKGISMKQDTKDRLCSVVAGGVFGGAVVTDVRLAVDAGVAGVDVLSTATALLAVAAVGATATVAVSKKAKELRPVWLAAGTSTALGLSAASAGMFDEPGVDKGPVSGPFGVNESRSAFESHAVPPMEDKGVSMSRDGNGDYVLTVKTANHTPS